ncbi:MAG: SAM-dependent methyltransferase [Rhodospirillaceae bacterium]|nr:SAM-dependent methyltransferase [Rhodospirillaceae bacterium]
MKENQYQDLIDVDRDVGRASFGLMSNQVWHDDPKRLVFVLARYKFVARLLEGRATVLEVGCADAFGTRIVQQSVGTVTAIDFDPEFIQDAQNRLQAQWPLDLRVHDILSGPIQNNFDAAYSIDVMEHILPEHEERFVENVAASINPNGTAIFGMPSLESQVYASKQSKAGHVNCKTGEQLKSDLERKFHNVFVFSMNDEVIHTGFYPMAHYLFAVCCGVR